MTKSIKSIIFACVFGLGINSGVSASHHTLLANGSETEFSVFMNKNAKRTVKKDEWEIVAGMIKLYNNEPAKLLSVDIEDREQFNAAISIITKKISTMKSNEALVWKSKLTTTAKVINYLWKQNLNADAALELEGESIVFETIGK
jgi:hypothetical protein